MDTLWQFIPMQNKIYPVRLKIELVLKTNVFWYKCCYQKEYKKCVRCLKLKVLLYLTLWRKAQLATMDCFMKYYYGLYTIHNNYFQQ